MNEQQGPAPDLQQELIFHRALRTEECARHLEAIASAMRAGGRFKLQVAERELCLTPSAGAGFALEARREGDNETLSIRVRWHNAAPPVSGDAAQPATGREVAGAEPACGYAGKDRAAQAGAESAAAGSQQQPPPAAEPPGRERAQRTKRALIEALRRQPPARRHKRPAGAGSRDPRSVAAAERGDGRRRDAGGARAGRERAPGAGQADQDIGGLGAAP